MVSQLKMSLYVDAGSSVPWLSPSCLPLVQRSESFVVTGGDGGTVCLPTSLLGALSPLVRDLQDSVYPSGHLLLPSANEKELVVIRQILTSGCSHKEVEEELVWKVQCVLALLQIKIKLVRVVLGNLVEEEVSSSSKVKIEEKEYEEESSVKEAAEEVLQNMFIIEDEISLKSESYNFDKQDEGTFHGNNQDPSFPDLVSEDMDLRCSTNNEHNTFNNNNKDAKTNQPQESEPEDVTTTVNETTSASRLLKGTSSESYAPPGKNISNIPLVQTRRLEVTNSTPNKAKKVFISKNGKIIGHQITNDLNLSSVPPGKVGSTTTPAATNLQKVQIVKSADGKIKVLGLLPGQQLVEMPDGKLQIFTNQACGAGSSKHDQVNHVLDETGVINRFPAAKGSTSPSTSPVKPQTQPLVAVEQTPSDEKTLPNSTSNIAKKIVFSKDGKVGIPSLACKKQSLVGGSTTPAATNPQKVQIVKSADGKINVRGLLPGQQLIGVEMPDGKLQIFTNQLACGAGSPVEVPGIQVLGGTE